MDYQSLVNSLDLKKGDSIWLSSELIRLILLFRKEGINFDGSLLLDSFQSVIGEEGTLILPVFSFEFSNRGKYDVMNTKGITGVLGNIALKRSDFSRTQHPMHSFMVWGKDREELVGMTNKNSFGLDSPFGYCVRRHVRQIILGTDYIHAMTFIHYAETICNVPYRFLKKFTGLYVDRDGHEEKRTYDYFARKLDIEPQEKFNRIGVILEEKGISRKLCFHGLECYDIDLAASLPILCDDIINNECKNMYDFNVERKIVFENNS